MIITSPIHDRPLGMRHKRALTVAEWVCPGDRAVDGAPVAGARPALRAAGGWSLIGGGLQGEQFGVDAARGEQFGVRA